MLQKPMFKISLINILFFLICFEGYGQQVGFSNYTPLSSEGKIHNDFLVGTIKKSNRQINEIIPELGFNKRRIREEFYLFTNLHINEILLGGKILFGDPTTKYVQNVAKNVLVNEPELFNQLRFYVVKSGSVNAFATQQGIIFVNIGLLSKLNNEAELAFIIAHEISHYKREHLLKSYIKNNKIVFFTVIL